MTRPITTRVIRLAPTAAGTERSLEVETCASGVVLVFDAGHRVRISAQLRRADVGALLDALRHSAWLLDNSLLALAHDADAPASGSRP